MASRLACTSLVRERRMARSPTVEQPDHIETIAWRAMLGKDEHEVSDEEIAALGAEHGPFQAADGEG